MQKWPAQNGKKRCYTCLIEKGTREFYRDKRSPDGFSASCKACKQPSVRNRWVRRYKITLEEYEALFVAQNGVCAICGLPECGRIHGHSLSLAVDHDHQTGKVRGLLCHQCNRAVGMLHNNPDFFESGARYLRQNQEA